ncbi:MAG: LD-carboxypeptidase, partial [Bacteroidota bacterium]|nr:LD-carboxypeptidase [Bacteroidota bacterium]
MIIPSSLSKGSTIAIVSPAGSIPPEHVLPAVALLQSLGYTVNVGENVFAQEYNFAGSDKQRTEDLQKALDNPEVSAIICSRGGYGTLRTLQNINWEGYLKHPKWIVGFSDITILHSYLHQKGVSSIHGAMTHFFLEDKKPTESFDTMHQCLTGEGNSYSFESNPLNRTGFVDAPIIGGNLSLLYSLRGTAYDLDTNGKILFIEDIGEYLYHLDRMMLNFKVGGKLENLAGMIVGQFSSMKDNDIPFGMDVNEI